MGVIQKNARLAVETCELSGDFALRFQSFRCRPDEVRYPHETRRVPNERVRTASEYRENRNPTNSEVSKHETDIREKCSSRNMWHIDPGPTCLHSNLKQVLDPRQIEQDMALRQSSVCPNILPLTLSNTLSDGMLQPRYSFDGGGDSLNSTSVHGRYRPPERKGPCSGFPGSKSTC